MKKADLIVDLQYGSTGKGLIAGYLAMKNEYDVVVTANMPNAGHTFIDRNGNKMVHKVLPNGVVSPKCKYVMIGAGAIFSVEQLIKEVTDLHSFGYHGFLVIIHPNAVPLQDVHRQIENEGHLSTIGSTKQGTSAAMIDKIDRSIANSPIAENQLCSSDLPINVYVATHKDYNKIIKEADNILLEGAQGFSLGINEQFYPYCTSRDCAPSRFMSDMAIPLRYLRKVIGVARVHPIRVGGTSGGHYRDQKETTWEEIGVEKEFTTVTGRERRVFTYSKQQIEDAMYMVQPDEVFLNFCNYASSEEVDEIVDHIGKVKYLGYGPTIHDVGNLS